MLKRTAAVITTPATAGLVVGCSETAEDQYEQNSETSQDPKSMKIHYLEIVTPDVEGAVSLHTQMHGVSFGAPDPNLGGARTAKLYDGGLLGIRAPMRDTEAPVVRPYYLVDDIEEAVASASSAGAEIAMGPTAIPESGKFAIFIQGGIETGLWQVLP